MELVRVKLDDGAEATVGKGFAESLGLTVLDKPAVDNRGTALDHKPAIDLRGADLDAALEAAGLSKSGTAADKRDRLAEASVAQGGSIIPNEESS